MNDDILHLRWKVTALIFMVLFVLLLIFVIFLFNIGSDALNKEAECSANICEKDKYDSYYYDDYEKICYCFRDREAVYHKYIGG